MEPQLPLEDPSSPPRRRRPGARDLGGATRSLLSALLFAAPVWIPAALLAQIGLLGLGPAWAEHRRLDRAEAEVRGRVDALLGEQQELLRHRRMLGDEIYRERVRRTLRDPELPPLTLSSAAARSDS